MKLTTMTQLTVDGVMQGNGGPNDDRRNGFERGGWALGKGDDETRTFINQTYQRADVFLFGRWTYELFAGSWGAIEGMRAHPIGVALNEKPKYVASNTLTEARWADTTVICCDLAAAISELKAKPGGELQVHGSGTLIRWLLANNLVDEINLLIVPVILGQMQYLVSVIDDKSNPGSTDRQPAISAFNERLIAEGYWFSRADSQTPTRPR